MQEAAIHSLNEAPRRIPARAGAEKRVTGVQGKHPIARFPMSMVAIGRKLGMERPSQLGR